MGLLESGTKHTIKVLHKLQLLAVCTLCVVVLTCTQNPFASDEEISSRTIWGKVSLTDGTNPEGVVVWLEGLDVGTRTDGTGEFILALPPPASSGTTAGVDGIFNLYYYIANYNIDSSKVVFVNGEVARGEGDIDEEGKLKGVKYLSKILNIETNVYPNLLPREYRGSMLITITLQPASGPVIVESLKRVEQQTLKRSGLLVVNDQDSVVITFGLDPGWSRALEEIQDNPELWRIQLTWTPCDLPIGNYRIIPYLLVRQDDVPENMIDYLGSDVHSLGPEYLKIPFVRAGGEFIIFESTI